MPLEGDQQLHDPGNAREDEPCTEGTESGEKLPPSGAPSYPPQSPCRYSPSDKNKSKWKKNTKFGLEIFGILVLFAYTWFSCLQWLQIRYTNYLTSRALDDGNTSLSKTLTKMQGQIDATNRLYAEAQKQTTSAGTMATNSGVQATATQNAADAAKSAAKTANESLHVSERAYLTTDAPILEGKDASLPVINRGHIPSGIAVVVVHGAIINTLGPKVESEIQHQPIYARWKHYAVNNLPSGLSNPLKIPIALPSLDLTKFNSGFQQVILVGNVTYNDGFPNTPNQVWDFCYISVLYTEPDRMTWGTCDPNQYLAPLIVDDGYPNNEKQY
jgi:hypothetical protein